MPPAGDLEDRARHIGGQIRRQEQGRARDIVRVAQAAQHKLIRGELKPKA